MGSLGNPGLVVKGFQVMGSERIVAGIDVGGMKKGYHLVVLRGETIVHVEHCRDPVTLVERCQELDVQAVGVDAPCRWAEQQSGRLAERQMASSGVFSFFTPTRERASANEKGFYGWMFNGERLYKALADRYPLVLDPGFQGGSLSFETFPHAVTCAFLGNDVASAKLKRNQRRQIIENHSINTALLKSIDAIDAALCALTAVYFLAGQTVAFGEAQTGYLFIPRYRESNRRPT